MDSTVGPVIGTYEVVPEPAACPRRRYGGNAPDLPAQIRLLDSLLLRRGFFGLAGFHHRGPVPGIQ